MAIIVARNGVFEKALDYVNNFTRVDILGLQEEYNIQTENERKATKKDIIITKDLFYKIFSAFAEKSRNKDKLKAINRNELDKIFELFDFDNDSKLEARYIQLNYLYNYF